MAGHFITDDIRLGSCDGTKSSGQIHIKNQKFGNVEKQHTIFTGSNFEAIVGLAYPALAERGVTPIFDEMINQKLLQSNLFAFYLSSVEDEKQEVSEYFSEHLIAGSRTCWLEAPLGSTRLHSSYKHQLVIVPAVGFPRPRSQRVPKYKL